MLELICPRRCYICGENLTGRTAVSICRSCLQQVDFVRHPVCICCGLMLNTLADGQDRYCGDCLKSPPPFLHARSLAIYREPVADLLRRFKYRAETPVIRVLDEILKTQSPEYADWHYDYIIPVPLHRARLKKRGFNQAAIIAAQAFTHRKKQIRTDLIRRVKNTVSQAGLDGKQRRKNLRNAFRVSEPAVVAGCRILLVDDVFTTGTTVAACSRELKKAGAECVYVWTFSRVMPGYDQDSSVGTGNG